MLIPGQHTSCKLLLRKNLLSRHKTTTPRRRSRSECSPPSRPMAVRFDTEPLEKNGDTSMVVVSEAPRVLDSKSPNRQKRSLAILFVSGNVKSLATSSSARNLQRRLRLHDDAGPKPQTCQRTRESLSGAVQRPPRRLVTVLHHRLLWIHSGESMTLPLRIKTLLWDLDLPQ